MDTVEEAHDALLNWARWARDDDPGLGVQPPPAFQWYRAGAAWEDGWGDQPAANPILPPVDERAAMALERLLLRLPVARWYILRRHYFLRATQPEIELQAALRALVDLSQRCKNAYCVEG